MQVEGFVCLSLNLYLCLFTGEQTNRDINRHRETNRLKQKEEQMRQTEADWQNGTQAGRHRNRLTEQHKTCKQTHRQTERKTACMLQPFIFLPFCSFTSFSPSVSLQPISYFVFLPNYPQLSSIFSYPQLPSTINCLQLSSTILNYPKLASLLLYKRK